MTHDRISVAMATYNGSKYLREQLDSLYSQTRIPDEIVVTDDCSIDDTVQILEEYRQSKGLKYYINEKSLGVNGNFYRAISLCSGDYIAICDQDDIWCKNKIECSYKKLKEIENNRPAAVSSQAIDIDAQGNILGYRKTFRSNSNYVDTLLFRGRSQGCSLFFNHQLKKIVLNNCSDNTMLYDVFISFTAAVVGIKYNMNDRLMYYRHHETNAIAKINKEYINTIERIKRKVKNEDRLSGFIPEERYHFLKVIYECYGFMIEDIRIKRLLEKVIAIDKHSFGYGCRILISIKELSVLKRISIIIKSIIINTLRHQYKLKNNI